MDKTKHALNYIEKLTSNRVSMSFDLNSQKCYLEMMFIELSMILLSSSHHQIYILDSKVYGMLFHFDKW